MSRELPLVLKRPQGRGPARPARVCSGWGVWAGRPQRESLVYGAWGPAGHPMRWPGGPSSTKGVLQPSRKQRSHAACGE